jgi:hypothetical protein
MRNDKYFPSLEDIIKVLKHKKIRTSYIYTEYGYWILNNLENAVDNNVLNNLENANDNNVLVIPEELKTSIQYHLDIFYHNTKKGRSYRKSAIDELIFLLNDTIQTSFPQFNIEWFNY